MKIERINENSIRCTLTSFDLSVRDLNIKELAYGTDKVRKLFTEMMTRASNEVGFEADGTPIMIEAIPLSSDSIQLVITKVDNPEELDARFSRFSPGPQGAGAKQGKGEDWLHKLTSELLEGAAGFLAQVQNSQENGGQAPEGGTISITGGPGILGAAPILPGAKPGVPKAKKKQPQPEIPENTCRAIGFEDLDTIFAAVRAAAFYDGESTLYKKPENGKYVLLIRGGKENHDEYAKVCNILTEYGYSIHTTAGTGAYYDEHYEVICKSPAIKKLAAVK